ncbi:MAG: sigma 54-interacting transcriptional regulator [Bacteroidota bacterium]
MQRADDGIFWVKSDGAITHVNEAACRRLGYTRRELTSMHILDINPAASRATLDNVFDQLRAHGSTLFEAEHQTKDGRLIPVEISTNYIHFEGGEYTCSFVRDITDRKRKEAALRGAFREIQELRERLEAENSYLLEEIKTSHSFGEIISQNRAMRALLREVEQVAKTHSTVLVLGESGTGKELIARALHQLSPRSDRPIIKVNCAALPANLIESELFGHEKGAFTGALSRKRGRFELADKGTLFLDEIGEMPMELQSKLLRVLQEGEYERLGGTETLKVDARIVAATNRNLEKEVQEGNFREDLFYRLNVFPIHCPPLRDRKEDIPLLVNHFCKKLETRIGKKITRVPQKLLDRLQAYHFPGNIRELENIVERAMILSIDGKLSIGNWIPQKKKLETDEKILSLEEVNRRHIVSALKSTNWKISGDGGAAKILGLKPTTLESRMKKLGIQRSTDAR